jgi:phosphate/sulfate permease
MDPKQRNIVIAVVVVVLLCCCCAAIGLGGWAFGDQIVEALGMARLTPPTML